ncbi:hypothetical protein HZA87_00600 [Candidatus Uhrbacteria bacterium]|nr:hypothetical protein [Candidatus Uhrbacteria bacterium]
MDDDNDFDFIVPESEGKKLLAVVQSGRTDVLPDNERKLADKLIAAIADISVQLREDLLGTLNRLNPQELFTIIKIIVSVRKKNRGRFFRFILGMEDDGKAEERGERNRNWSAARYIAAGPVYIDAMWQGLEEYRKTGILE